MSEPTQEPTPTSPAPTPGARRWLEVAAFAGLAVGIGAAVQAWPRLPEVIPMHFDIAGRPDGWGGRGTLLLMPGSSLFLYLLLTLVQRLPARWYSFPVGITEENRARQHRLALDLVLWMKVALVWMFAHLTVLIARTALGQAQGLGAATMLLWVGGIFVLLGIYLVRALRAR